MVAAEFDSSAELFVAVTDCKQLLIWNVEDDWKLHSTRFVELVLQLQLMLMIFLSLIQLQTSTSPYWQRHLLTVISVMFKKTYCMSCQTCFTWFSFS